MHVLNPDIPDRIRAQMDAALTARAAQLSGQPMLRALTTFLDNRLETLLSGRAVAVTAAPAERDSGAAAAAAAATTAGGSAAVEAEATEETFSSDRSAVDSDSAGAGSADDAAAGAADVGGGLAAETDTTRTRSAARSGGTKLTLGGLRLGGVGVLQCRTAHVVLSCDRCRQQADATCPRDSTCRLVCTRCHVPLSAVWHPGTLCSAVGGRI
jgi:hypothetical protein